MSEQAARTRMSQAARYVVGLHWCPVENGISVGYPDTSFSIAAGAGPGIRHPMEGHLELKFAKHWPKRESTTFKLKHFTTQQREWIITRTRCGGIAGVVLRVANDGWYLYLGTRAICLGDGTTIGLHERQRAIWHSPSMRQHDMLSMFAAMHQYYHGTI